jgi:hypothetical protein
MSEDFVNNITLNYLISKTQLQKLNKKMKQTKEEAMRTDREIYKEQIISLFMELLENDRESVSVLEEVKNGFDYFVEKTIYHIKMQEIAEEREKENAPGKKDKETIIVTKSSSSSSLCEDNSKIDDENIEDDDENIEDDDENIEDDHENIEEGECDDDPIDMCEEEKEKPKIVYKQKMDWFDIVKMKRKATRM